MARSARSLLFVFLALLITASTAAPVAASSSSFASPGGTLRWLFASGSATGGKVITLRVTMWGDAPASGATVSLKSSNPAVPVPSRVVVPVGESELIVKVRTLAVTQDTPVLVTATYKQRVRTQTIVVLRPYLSSTTVQTRIRSGHLGKIIVRLSGIAPEGGVTVRLNSNRPSVLPVPATVYFAEGKASVSVNVPAARVSKDVHINVSAMYRGVKITKPTIVRKWKPSVTQEPTGTVEPSATATATDEPSATSTATDEPSQTATATADATGDADQTATTEADQTATAEADQTSTAEAELTATTEAELTATTEAELTATKESIDATATQESIDATATQESIDATATAEAEQTEIADQLTATAVAEATEITICHVTGAGSYTALPLSLSGVFNGHLEATSGDHEGTGGDIIPPFTYKGQTYSQNWDEAGRAIYNNSCQSTEPTTDGNEETFSEETVPVTHSLTISVDSLSVPTGSTVTYTVCLAQPATSTVSVTWFPAQAKFDDPVNSGSATIEVGGQCLQVPFSGLNRGNGAPTGTGYLIFTLGDGQVFYGPEVTFKGKE